MGEIEELMHFISDGAEQFKVEDLEMFCQILWGNWMDAWRMDMFSHVTDVLKRMQIVQQSAKLKVFHKAENIQYQQLAADDDEFLPEIMGRRFFQLFSEDEQIDAMEFHKACLAINPNIEHKLARDL